MNLDSKSGDLATLKYMGVSACVFALSFVLIALFVAPHDEKFPACCGGLFLGVTLGSIAGLIIARISGLKPSITISPQEHEVLSEGHVPDTVTNIAALFPSLELALAWKREMKARIDMEMVNIRGGAEKLGKHRVLIEGQIPKQTANEIIRSITNHSGEVTALTGYHDKLGTN